MLTRTDIRRETNMQTYARGRELYEADHVMEISYEAGEYDYISAQIKGSRSRIYQVDLAVDTQAGTVVLSESSCNCPAFSTYGGICKHCVAVLLEYVDHNMRQQTMQKYEEKRRKLENYLEETQKGKNFAFAKVVSRGIRPATTEQMWTFLQKQTQKRALPVLQQETYGRVRLEPEIHLNEQKKIEVGFRIGVEQMYVLKDVIGFYDSMNRQEEYSYGKRLNFIHMMQAFSEESRPLCQFILDWVRDNRVNYQEVGYYDFYSKQQGSSMAIRYKKVRHMRLDPTELDRFMDLIVEQPVMAELPGLGEQRYMRTEGRVKRKVKITAAPAGINVKLLPMTLYKGSRNDYYFYNNKIYTMQQEGREQAGEFEQCMNKIQNQTAFIAEADIPVFCQELLPMLENYYEVEKKNFDPHQYSSQEASFEFYLDAPQRDLIQIKPTAVYGENRYSVYQKAEVSENRDVIKEALVARMVSAYGNAYDDSEKLMGIYEDDDKIYDFLVNGIPALQQVGEVFISDALKKIRIEEAPKVSVGISLSGNLLELSLTAGEMEREELVDILSRYKTRKKYYRLKDGSFVHMENEDMELFTELKHGLQLTDKQLRQDKIALPRFHALYVDAELREHQGIRAEKNREFKSLIRNMKTVDDNDFDIPESLEVILREYQKRGFLWIKTLKSNGFGGILADDMGLGKTLQVITFLLSEYQEGNHTGRKALIVSPASLVFNWKSEIQRFAPELPVRMVVGTAAQRRKVLQETVDGMILLTSYDLLKRDIAMYEGMDFSCEIIDEAQYIKNQGTQVAKAVKTIQAEFKLALTGTPVENKLSELWSIFDYLMPGFLYSYKQFKEEMESAIVQNQDEGATTRLQKMIRPFVLRRLKREVLTDLPDKLEEDMYAQLEGEQQKLYDAHVKRMQLMLEKQSEEEFKHSKIQILSELTRLRQLCCDPALIFEDYKGNSAKLDMCINMIENAVSGGHKILLFSQFTTMLGRIEERLQKADITYYSLTGATSKEKRAQLVEAFNQDDTSVFCISLKAGGTGLNLTAADIVIHYDPWWNVAVQNQATDRAHRIGQKNVVNVYKLLVKDTIEENIRRLQDRKQQLADEILGGEGISTASFTREEIMEILGGRR